MTNSRTEKALLRLLGIVATLRSPGGCPWDAEQTPETMRRYLLEEAHEVLEAINRGDSGEICRELGDLLLQIIFQARLFEEKGAFDFTEVMDSISEKLVRRHPHVFASGESPMKSDLDLQWQAIKEEERPSGAKKTSFAERIPPTLPSLARAGKILDFLTKFNPEKFQAFRNEYFQGLKPLLKDLTRGPESITLNEEDLGMLLFYLADVGRRNLIDLEEALRATLSRLETTLGLLSHATDKRGPVD